MDNYNVDRHTKKASRNADAECFHDDVSTVKKYFLKSRRRRRNFSLAFWTRLLETGLGAAILCPVICISDVTNKAGSVIRNCSYTFYLGRQLGF